MLWYLCMLLPFLCRWDPRVHIKLIMIQFKLLRTFGPCSTYAVAWCRYYRQRYHSHSHNSRMAPNLAVTMLITGRRSILLPTWTYGSCLRCLHCHQLIYYCFSQYCLKAAEVTGWDIGLFVTIWDKGSRSICSLREGSKGLMNSMWSTCIRQHWDSSLSKWGKTEYQSLILGQYRCAIMNCFLI